MSALLMPILIWTSLTIVAAEYNQSERDAMVAPAFVEAGITPGVVDPAPPTLLRVYYPPDIVVFLGRLVSNFVALREPYVTWRADPNKFYTLLVLGPQFPATYISTGLVFWHVENIPGNKVSEGSTLTFYLKPPNTPGTGGAKQQVYIVYEQSYRLDTDVSQVTGEARLINPKAFMEQNQLIPFAGNYHLTDPITKELTGGVIAV